MKSWQSLNKSQKVCIVVSLIIVCGLVFDSHKPAVHPDGCTPITLKGPQLNKMLTSSKYFKPIVYQFSDPIKTEFGFFSKREPLTAAEVAKVVGTTTFNLPVAQSELCYVDNEKYYLVISEGKNIISRNVMFFPRESRNNYRNRLAFYTLGRILQEKFNLTEAFVVRPTKEKDVLAQLAALENSGKYVYQWEDVDGQAITLAPTVAAAIWQGGLKDHKGLDLYLLGDQPLSFEFKFAFSEKELTVVPQDQLKTYQKITEAFYQLDKNAALAAAGVPLKLMPQMKFRGESRRIKSFMNYHQVRHE